VNDLMTVSRRSPAQISTEPRTTTKQDGC
jgi:hypothetical protein